MIAYVSEVCELYFDGKEAIAADYLQKKGAA
jgi:hypothetical protein